jgi:8-oxo-dGTP diphosphatase
MTTIVVAAAVIEENGRYLLTRRQPGVHLEGLWEFPGGKCDVGESHAGCLVREIREELAVAATVGEELLATVHAYPDRHVELHFLRCTIAGAPLPQLGQEMRWATPEELPTLPFPPADAELIRLLCGASGTGHT